MKNNNEKATTEFNIPMEVTDETIRDFRITIHNLSIKKQCTKYYNEPINQDKELKKISDYDIIIIK